MLSMALSGRTPRDGDIMSIGLAAFTPADRTIHAVGRWNLLPQHPAPFSNTEVCGFWNGRPAVVDTLMQDRVPAAAAMQGIADFLKPFGKVTLVGNPLMTLYGFLADAWARFGPDGAAAPWGFSGVCAKSFASGALGVAVKDLAKDPRYVAWHEGLALNTLPCNDAAVGAVVYCNAVHHQSTTAAAAADAAAADEPAPGVKWLCDKPATMTTAIATTVAPVADAAGVAFAEYPKIFDADFVGDDVVRRDVAAAMPDAGDDQWYVTEKVHGANLSLWVDAHAEDTLRVAKRTGFLAAADAKGFFDFDRLAARVRAPVMALAAKAKAHAVETMGVDADAIGHVVVFGEIAGGEYEAVPRDIRGRRVQAGVQYAPTNFFYAFDVAIALKGANGDEKPEALRFLPTQWLQDEAPRTATFIPAVPVSGPMPLADALAVSAEFPSRIPELLGLPALGTANYAEGVVIRPARNASLADGRRAIVKRKHPMFREFQAAGAAGLSAAELVFSMINRNRVAAVASKRTADETADPAVLAGLVLEDAMADAEAAVTARGDKFDAARMRALHSGAFDQALHTAISEFRA